MSVLQKELLSNERKLEESMAHTREISKLVNIIERTIEDKTRQIASLTKKLSSTSTCLGKTEKELVEAKSLNRNRKEEIDVLMIQLENEKTEEYCTIIHFMIGSSYLPFGYLYLWPSMLVHGSLGSSPEVPAGRSQQPAKQDAAGAVRVPVHCLETEGRDRRNV